MWWLLQCGAFPPSLNQCVSVKVLEVSVSVTEGMVDRERVSEAVAVLLVVAVLDVLCPELAVGLWESDHDALWVPDLVVLVVDVEEWVDIAVRLAEADLVFT
eukprot:TRINITY_DN22440_c0_g1_i2.p1 TRINITY_DN22440_c0_g1~~TRINITY_DN22440_c0_g1_i2.p1  ORF type:complete len:102 (+),score=18.56 TRINITY_DN22440_c0_g1_i2:263-568(+)